MCQCRYTRLHAVAHRYTYSIPCCRTSQQRRTFILLSVSMWNDLADPVFDGVGLAGFKSRDNAFFIGISCSILCVHVSMYVHVSCVSTSLCLSMSLVCPCLLCVHFSCVSMSLVCLCLYFIFVSLLSMAKWN